MWTIVPAIPSIVAKISSVDRFSINTKSDMASSLTRFSKGSTHIFKPIDFQIH